MQYVTDDIFVNENVKFDSDHLPCVPSENIFLYVCSEGLDLRTIVTRDDNAFSCFNPNREQGLL